jgi:hypothetical protein
LDVLTGERAGRDGASVHHHGLAGGREDGVQQHQQEDRVEPVVADDGREEIGDLREDRRDRHGREL